MSGNTAAVEAIYAELAKGDIPAVLAALDPRVTWTEADGFPYAGTYTGPDAVLQNVLMKLGSEWAGFSAIAHELVTEGDTVVALGDYSGKYNATGKSFEAPFVHVWKFKDGKVVSFRQHTDTAVVQKALRE